MSANTWVTKADVLKDIGQIKGRNETNTLEQFVVEGDRAPPIRQDIDGDDEMQYYFGASYKSFNTPLEADNTPDINGITRMLQMVNDLDDLPESDGPRTLFRDSATDTISISKLNPNVRDFVPSGCRPPKSKNNPKTPESLERIVLKKPIFVCNNINKSSKENVGPSTVIEKEDDKPIIVKTQLQEQNNLNNNSAGSGDSSTINVYPKPKIEKINLTNSQSTPEVTTKSISENASLNEKQNKTETRTAEIDLLKKEVRSKILKSSKDNSPKTKSARNFAMAHLMKLCAAPPVAATPVEDPVMLVTPQCIKSPACDTENTEISKEIKEEPELSQTAAQTSTTSKLEVNQYQYVDPFVKESISKVNNWFDNTSPKPKLSAPPVQLQSAVAFKKKSTSRTSVNTHTTKSETNSEKNKTSDSFRPSEYAKDLLSRYEKNAAMSKVPPKEDFGEMLERKLKEKDELIRKKMEKKNGISPS